jgi:hypothetical protein
MVNVMGMLASMLGAVRQQQGPDSVTSSIAAMAVADKDEAEQAGRLEQWMAAWKKGEDAANAQINERKKKEE